MSGDNPKKACGDRKLGAQYVPPALDEAGARALGEGAEKYGPFNWRYKPVEVMTYVGAIKRHLNDFIEGVDVDPDSSTGKLHLDGIVGSCAILLDSQKHGTLIDNRPGKPAALAAHEEFDARRTGVEAVYLRVGEVDVKCLSIPPDKGGNHLAEGCNLPQGHVGDHAAGSGDYWWNATDVFFQECCDYACAPGECVTARGPAPEQKTCGLKPPEKWRPDICVRELHHEGFCRNEAGNYSWGSVGPESDLDAKEWPDAYTGHAPLDDCNVEGPDCYRCELVKGHEGDHATLERLKREPDVDEDRWRWPRAIPT